MPDSHWCDCGYDLTKLPPSSKPIKQPSLSDSINSAPTELHRTTSYFIRHWYGQLSLKKTFWLNYLLINFLIGFAHGFLKTFAPTRDYRLVLLQIYVLTVLVQFIILLPWQCVGLWRSARAHMQATKRQFWGKAAQGICLFWIGYTFVSLPITIPMYYEMGRIALGAAEYAYTLTLLSENTVQLDGGIGYGISNDLKDLLKQHGQIRIIVLNSPGGLIDESGPLLNLVQEHKLMTITEAGCLSACTDVFMAGAIRAVKESNPQLGFHTTGFPGLPDWVFASANERGKKYLISRGVKPEFAEKAYTVSNTDMWFPTTKELIDARVVTHIFDGENYIPVQ